MISNCNIDVDTITQSFNQSKKSKKITYDWIKSFVYMSNAKILRCSNFDVMLFHRYLSSILQLFVSLTIIILSVLIFFNILHEKKISKNVRDLDRFNWTNIDVNHVDYYWIHIMMLIYIVVFTCEMIYRKMIFYIKIRQYQFRIYMQNRNLNVRTILVIEISKNFLFFDKLNSLYSKIFDEIKTIWINRDYKKLIKTIKQRDKFRAILKNVEFKIMKKFMSIHIVDRVKKNRTKTNHDFRRERQNIKLNSLSWLFILTILNKKMKIVDQYRYEMIRLNHEITIMQTNVTKFSKFNFVFIIFENAIHVNLTFQFLIDFRFATLIIQCIEIEFHQIVWKNLKFDWWKRFIRIFLMNVCVIFLIIT